MLLRLFLLFTLIPIAELALLIRIGGYIGLGPTLGLVIATGAAGAWLARREGLRSWLAVQGELATGRVPGEELGHGVLILMAGIVLLTPGVITDVMGIALLLRPVRTALIRKLRVRFERQVAAGTAGFVGGPGVGVFWGGTPPGGQG
ncbi:MAG: FxsA family protein, partial [Gemmatimonadota bacterium]|nr:FxsA family protein [Gemmatimonadota bacterium]